MDDLDGVVFEAAYSSLSQKPEDAATIVSAEVVQSIDAYGGEVLVEYSITTYGGDLDGAVEDDTVKSEFLQAFNGNIPGTEASAVAVSTTYAQVLDDYFVTFSGTSDDVDDTLWLMPLLLRTIP